MKGIVNCSIVLTVVCVSSVCAHLSKGSLSIKGDESFTAGSTVEITWKMAHAHNIAHFIYFRPDSQSEWSCIDSVSGEWNKLDYSYSWKIPDNDTSGSAQIKIFLPEFSKTPSNKEDDFTLISLPFVITPPKVAVHAPDGEPLKAVSRNTTRVRSAVFSLDGRLVDERTMKSGRVRGVPRLKTVRRRPSE